MVLSEYGIDINKSMINGSVPEQVSPYKYLGSWITEDGKCELDIKSRIDMAKDSSWKQRTAKG